MATSDPLPAAAPAPSRRKPAVRVSRMPDALSPAQAAELHRLAARTPDAGPGGALAACVALRDAPLSDALAARLWREAPQFIEAMVACCEAADEGSE